MKKRVSIISMLFFLSIQFLFAQWISFDKTMKEIKPSVKVLSSDNSGALIEISLSGMELKEKKMMDKTFHSLSIPDYYTTLEVGKPQLPAIRELLGVPDFKICKINIVDSSVITLTDYNVNPFQKLVREGEKEEFIIDESFYQKDIFFPENIVELDNPSIWRDVRISKLSIFPVRFNPRTKILKIYQKIVVKINFENTTGNAITTQKPISKEWKQLYKNSVINYEYLPFDSHDLRKSNSINSVGDYDYLIITANNYYNDIQILAHWKTRRGLLSKVVLISDIGNNENSIKNYIINEYTTHNIKYVLLVGNINQICWQNTYPPGDYNYSLLAGGDNDFSPEIAIGRISAFSTPEVKHIISKGINYETIPPVDSWVRSVLLVSNKEDAPGKYQGCSEEIRTNVYSDNPVFTKAYGASTSVGGNQATNAQVTSYINSGFGVVNYRGHGTEVNWSNWNIYSEDFTTSNAAALNNGNKMPIVFSIACSNSALYCGGYCLAEVFTKANYGATAFLGATQPSLTEVNHVYDKKIFTTAFNSNIHSLGNISNAAANTIIGQFGSAGVSNAQMYLWLGDPAIDLWTNTIQQYSDVQITDNGSSLTVNAGVAGSTICVSSSNNGLSFYQRQDDVSSYTFNTSTRPLYITVTKHNYVPYTLVTGGTFTSNENWLGTMKVLGSVVMNSGTTLTVSPGTTISYANGASLIVNGVLNAVGTSSQPIIFTRNGSSNSWGSIILNGAGANGSNLNYITMQYGTDIQFLNGAIGTLQNSTISNCNRGVYVYNSKANIRGNSFQNNLTDGITCNASGFTHEIHGNTIRKTDSIPQYRQNSGLYFLGTSYGNISQNDISGYGYGTYIGGGATAYFLKNQNLPYTYPNNRIKYCNRAITAAYGGSVCNDQYYYMWYSSIFNNFILDLYAYQSGTIYSVFDYFGGGNPSSDNDWTSTISVSNPLSYDPWGGIPRILSDNSSTETPLLAKSISSSSVPQNVEDDVDKEFEFEQQKNYAGAIEYYQGLLEKGKKTRRVLAALAHFGAEAENRNVTNYFESLKEIKDEHQAFAMELLAGLYTRQGENQKNAAIYDELIKSFPNTYHEKIAWFQKFYYAFHVEKNNTKASQLLSTIKSKYSKDDNEGNIELAESILNSSAEIKKNEEGFEVTATNELLQNYPNPFNPSTVINYQLPNVGTQYIVSLKVYDMLGREIAVIANGIKEAGNYMATFDGSHLASGIYFARLTATPSDGSKPFAQVRKLLLTK